MSNENDSKWSAKMLITWAILIDIGLLGCLFIMPLLRLIQDLFQLIYLLIISWFHSMSTIFRRWKNRLRCSGKRSIQHSRSSIFADTDLKTVTITMDRLANENHLLKERFDKLDEKYQRWIGDEQIYLLKRIEQLETENRQLHLNYRTYQLKSEKCLQSVTDLIIKLLFTQEELKKQCTDIHNAFDTVQLRKKVQRNESIPRNARSISCQFTSNSSNQPNRHTTNDQSTWFHRDLMIVEKDDLKMKIDQPTGMK
ncbi:unnamed protein product [Adineta ricciae]|uniref:Uncharacterized protein n=1 Tax=Adineta ricciae TaxID=249248 RepID=A0A813Y089_ADIRI|nr:unnamed protein product [Adineta ricciae]